MGGTAMMRRFFVILLVSLAVPAVIKPALADSGAPGVPAAVSAGRLTDPSDFNGDGYSDMATGAGREDIGSIANAGGVNVIYGSATGLRPAGNQFWSQDSTNIAGKAEKGDSLGAFSIASGDMNGDGISDVALGVHAEDIGSVVDAGGVNVIYGSSAGLTST